MASPNSEPKDAILRSLSEAAAHYGHLKDYVFDLGFPLLLHSEESPLPCRETPADLEVVDAHFAAQIHALFEALHAFQDSPGREDEAGPPIHQEGLHITIKLQLQSFDRYLRCYHRTFHTHRLSLRDPGSLPELSRVTRLRLFSAPDRRAEVSFANARPVSLRVPLECAVRLPALQELDFPWLWEWTPIAFPSSALRHYTRPWEGPWRDARHEFGRAVDELHGRLPATLKKARLLFWKPSFAFDDDQAASMPDLVAPVPRDPVSLGLRTLASHLEDLDVRAFITPDLFAAPVHWPRLRRLRVEFHPCRPDGSWYFVGPRGEDPNHHGFEVAAEHYPPTAPNQVDEEIDREWREEDGDEEDRQPDMFRTEPLADKIEPLLAAFSAAVKSTPTLEEAELFTYLAWQPSEQRELEYGDDAPYDIDNGVHRWGVRYIRGQSGANSLVECQFGDWRPDEEVIESLENMGGGEGVDVVWKPFEFTERREVNHEARYFV